jgi:uncharacterized repeat protein (TIGR01451 family)
MFTGFTMMNTGGKRNIRINLLAGGAQGNVLCEYINCTDHQRMFCAPFMVVGTHYDIIAPPIAYLGQSAWITIIVVDAAGTTKDDYCGTTSFTSTDPGAKIEGGPMDLYNYTWKSSTVPCVPCGGPCDGGIRIFLNVTFTKLGMKTIVAGDTMDGSISGLAAVLVVGVDVRLSKEPRFVMAASADTVGFKVCWSNYSSASAFTLVLTDAVPMGMTFVPEVALGAFNCGNTDGLSPIVAYSTVPSANTPPAASFTTALPITGSRWLRWTIPMAGVQTSGCVCYRAQIN